VAHAQKTPLKGKKFESLEGHRNHCRTSPNGTEFESTELVISYFASLQIQMNTKIRPVRIAIPMSIRLAM
jgi:hypothetical protein